MENFYNKSYSEAIHYYMLQCIAILEPTVATRYKCSEILVKNIEKLQSFVFETIELWTIEVTESNIVISTDLSNYTIDYNSLLEIYARFKKVLPKYLNTYHIKKIVPIAEGVTPICTITDKEQLKRVSKYISKTSVLYEKSIERVYIGKNKIVATDKTRLIHENIECENELLLTKEMIAYILKTKEESTICEGGNHYAIYQDGCVENFEKHSEKYEGKYPNWQRVIPQNNECYLTVDRKEFLKSLKRMKALEVMGVKLTTKNNQLTIGCKFPVYGSYIQLYAQSNSDIEISFAVKDLLEVVSTNKSKEITIKVASNDTAAIIDENIVLMPYFYSDKDETIEFETKDKEIKETTVIRHLPAIYKILTPSVIEISEIIEAKENNLLPVLYVKPKKTRKPREKKVKVSPVDPIQRKETIKTTDMYCFKESRFKSFINKAAKKRDYIYLLFILFLGIAAFNTKQIPSNKESKEVVSIEISTPEKVQTVILDEIVIQATNMDKTKDVIEQSNESKELDEIVISPTKTTNKSIENIDIDSNSNSISEAFDNIQQNNDYTDYDIIV